MKTFKELKNRITESSGEHTFGGGFGDTFVKTNPNSAIKAYGKGIFDIGKEDNLKRVNAFANAFWKGIKDEPNAHLGVFKTKLNLLGLDFPHDEFDNENGFENGDSYNLNINMGDVNGTCDITANVVKSEGIDGEFEA